MGRSDFLYFQKKIGNLYGVCFVTTKKYGKLSCLQLLLHKLAGVVGVSFNRFITFSNSFGNL